ncbi:LytTR family DNA-binding domain-containing protein [Lachnospiraceae bacterium 54-53]
MVKIALCDDSREIVEKYAELIAGCAERNNLEIELSCFYSGESLLFYLTGDPDQVDIIYLDILMDKTDGMETARKLRDSNCNAQIVFLTSCEDYVYEAFDVEAVQYMLKAETTDDKFERVFLKAVELASQKKKEMFICEFDGEKIIVPIHQISYFEIWKRIVAVYYGEGQIAKFYASMDQLEKQFSEKGFVRVHRSYMVHLSYISRFDHQKLILKTGAVIPVGGTYTNGLKRKFSEYISCRHIHHLKGEYGSRENKL